MSFITINDRAGRIGERASVAGLFGVTEALFYARNAGRAVKQGEHAGLMTIVALALILVLSSGVLALAFLRSMPAPQPAPTLIAQLHPSCSPDHDCFVAKLQVAVKPQAAKVEIEGNPFGILERDAKFDDLREDADLGHSDVAISSEAPAAGALAPQTPRVSGPTASKDRAAAVTSSKRKASADKPAAGAKARPAMKQAKLQKSAPASKKG